MEQKEIKKITLSELIDVANKYTSGEWSENTFNEYKQTISIIEYIPIRKKAIGIIILANDYISSKNTVIPEMNIIDFYTNIFFNVLLKEYALIEIDDESLVNYDNYDLLYPLFYKFILNYCKDDFDLYKDMINNFINYNNIKDLINTLENFDSDKIQEGIENNRNMIESLSNNKELINNMTSLIMMNDPFVANIVNEIKNK